MTIICSKKTLTLNALGESIKVGTTNGYYYIRATDSNGKSIFLEKPTVPQEIDSYLHPGGTYTLYISEQKNLTLIYGIEIDGRKIDFLDELETHLSKEFKKCIVFFVASIPMCIILVGFIFLFGSLIGFFKCNKQFSYAKEMRKFIQNN